MPARKRKSSKKKSKGAGWLVLAAFLVLLVAASAVAGAAAWLIFAPFGPSAETFVTVTPGWSTARIGRELQAAGVVRYHYAFEALRFWKRGTLRAGDYRFDHPASALEIYERIARGDVYTKAVTIPEGSNIYDIGAKLEQAGLGSKQEFVHAAMGEPGLVADLDPAAGTLEGYLFPDTYHISPRAKAPEIAAIMVRRFKAEAALLGLRTDVHKTVTLASLVERETAVNGERATVASVFENRLAAGMPLATDPAVIYGLQLENRWRGTIYQSDLTRDTPYNTYLHKGLPPGPIANPGAKALQAAMHPATTDYLYFVAAGADPQGHSVFSRTLEEQNKAVAGYRSAIKKTGAR